MGICHGIHSYKSGGCPVLFSHSTGQLYRSSWTETSVSIATCHWGFFPAEMCQLMDCIPVVIIQNNLHKVLLNVILGSEFQNKHCCSAEVLGWFVVFVFLSLTCLFSSSLFLMLSLTLFLCPCKTWKVVGEVLAFLSQCPVTWIPAVLIAQKWQARQRLTHKTKMEINGKLNIAINRQSYYLSFHI